MIPRCGKIDLPECNNEIIYSKKTEASKLLERLTHQILRDVRIDQNREWFRASFDQVKEALDIASLIVDVLPTKSSHNVQHFGLANKIKELLNQIPDNIIYQPSVIKPPQQQPVPEIEMEMESEEDVVIDENIVVKDATNFDQFIDECCILDDNATELTINLEGAHRLWSQTQAIDVRFALKRYLKNRFKVAKKIDPTTNSVLTAYKGVKVKPLEFPFSSPPTDIDEFVQANCSFAYYGRTSCKEIYKQFEEWKQQNSDPDYSMCPKEKDRIYKYLGARLLSATIYCGKTQGRHGFFGIVLKGVNEDVGKKCAKKVQKPIVKIDITTRKVVERFESLNSCALKQGINMGKMSTLVTRNSTVDGHIFMYEKDLAIKLDESRASKRRNTTHGHEVQTST